MPVNPEFPTPLLNVEQIGERLQLPKSAVYELIRQGKLPAVRIGKHVRIEAGRLEQWIAEHRNGAVDNATRIPTKFRPVVRD
jgi:excisionase family DNA binding protein